MNSVRILGNDGGAVWDEAVPVYVTRLGELIEKSAHEIFLIFTDNVVFVPRCPLR